MNLLDWAARQPLPGPSRAKCRTCGKRRVNMAAVGGGRPICRECMHEQLMQRGPVTE